MNTHAHHTHLHDHHARQHGQAFLIGIALNSLFIFVEIAYGIRAGSLALLADAGHNAGDVLGLAMSWGAAQLAQRKVSERFTYGLQSTSIFAAMANALLLMVAVGGIGLEAMQRLTSPSSPAAMTVIAVALAGVAVNGISAWLFHAGREHDLNIQSAFTHMAGDAAISLGVALSGFIILCTGWLWLDPLASLAIAAAIIVSTWRLLRDSVSLALHAVPAMIDLAEVKAWLSAQAGVVEVHDLHIWAMSTTGVALSAHLLMPGGHPGDHFIRNIGHGLEHRFHIGHATLQIETGDNGDVCDIGCAQTAHSH